MRPNGKKSLIVNQGIILSNSQVNALNTKRRASRKNATGGETTEHGTRKKALEGETPVVCVISVTLAP
eukprot:10633165-Heterocapsa_arctica.AAC.1